MFPMPSLEEVVATLREKYPFGHPRFLELTVQEAELHSEKNHDYAKGGDPLGNFDRVASILALYPGLDLSDRKVVALVYALKQMDAVLWGLSAKIQHRVEGFLPRLRDISVYSKIVMCMVEDEGSAKITPGTEETRPWISPTARYFKGRSKEEI